MLDISGYLKDADEDLIDTQNSISVNSCGHYKLIKSNRFETLRPSGRKDYQLLYIAHGKADFFIDDKLEQVSQESFVLYYPNEKQHYIYNRLDHPDVYWIHFSGNRVEELLTKYSLNPHHIFHVSAMSEFARLFDSIIKELQLKREHYLELSNTYLTELLLTLSRKITEESSIYPVRNALIEQAIEYFHKEYKNDISIEDYACKCNLSCCWFIRSFKSYTGSTPLQYLTDIRLNKAKELLKNNTFNISETAAFVGYTNPLYFSRLFKKYTNMTPTEYQKGKLGP